jgi:hypothetical protein
MYIINKYLLLSTPNYNFCYWVWEALQIFNNIWGAAGSKSLRNTDLTDISPETLTIV